MPNKPSKFKRLHAGYVLVVRHPDTANQITIDGDVQVIDIDLGSAFDGAPENEQEAVSFAENLPSWLDRVPITSTVYGEVLYVVAHAVDGFPAAEALVTAYRTRRET